MSSALLSRWRGELELLSVVLMWGLNFPVMKIILRVMDPLVLNVFRILAAGLVLSYIYYRRCGGSWAVMTAPYRTHGWLLLRLGFVGWIAYQVAFIEGLNMTTAGNGALIMGSAPLWTALVAWATGVEKLRVLSWIGLLVSIVGTAAVVIFGTATIDFGGDVMIGNLVILGAAFLWGTYTALTRPLVNHMTPTALTVLALLPALPVLVLLALPFVSTVAWSSILWWHWVLIFLSGSLSTGIAIVLWNRGIRTIGASHTAAFGNLPPFVALFSGYFMLGDPVLPGQLVGGVLIIGGLVLMRRARATPRTPAPSVH